MIKLRNKFNFWRLWLTDRRAFYVMRSVMDNGWSYLTAGALTELRDSTKQIEQANLSGIFVEAGCALGGSAIIIAQAKSTTRPLYIYDAFGMIPPPSERDHEDAHARYAEIAAGHSHGIKGQAYYGYEANLLEKVRDNFATCGLPVKTHQVEFIAGFYEETLKIDQPVALAHIDCDWHDSVLVCLQQIVPHLVKGGLLIIDDYDEWSGCKRAVDSYFAGREDKFTFTLKSRLHIRRL
ncbi:MAG: TylF/MycF/NovP-related O-methyltransferase [Caldilineaceae bacterium]